MTVNRKHSRIVLLVIFILLIGLAIPSYIWTKRNIQDLGKWQNSRLSPVIMIPGSSATINRFDDLVKLLNKNDHQKHSLLKVKVYNNGKIKYYGKIRSGDNEPIIVVGFENNHDGYNNILKQAKMFNEAFKSLQKRYYFNNFKAIGHSNGGLVYTAFLEKYYKDYDVKMTRLMTIGSPFNFGESNLKYKTQMLADFIKQRGNLPKDLVVYSVAGTENYDSDGLVPVNSVEAGKYVFQNQVKSYTEITVTGINAQHSDLPQNQQIVDLIQKYILDNQMPKNDNDVKKDNK
ncbi:alpha/beta hydrolase [Ligilactobacillus cholophilus]|uniref:alpha/beta hydrolase n=1 Tax=Ligilactobacillus cholophilus TaxID=3050131 RepID=UPI0025AEEE47|nr:alpha/beta hydrolase [Ligilactobacillus cholophilus]